MVSATQTILWSVFIAFSGYIFHEVSLKLTDPFIDEIFHLNQCKTYCEYKFDVWDNKITTPPGLYLLGFAYARAIQLVSTGQLLSICGNYNILRSLNLLGGVLVLPLIVSKLNHAENQFWAVNIVSLPLLFTYYFLFYTDIWSLVFVVGALVSVSSAKKSGMSKLISTSISGVLGFSSLWFRQTNVIWLAFIAATFIDSQISVSKSYVCDYVRTAFSNIQYLLPFVLNFAAFGAFLKINGGITFGDKENHQVQIHLVQVFYCFLFINVFTVPSWLSAAKLTRYIKVVVGYNNWFLVNIMVSALSVLSISYIIEHFTIVHPFLLADNRHYTFYLWRRVLSQPWAKYLMVPVYHFSCWNIYDSFRRCHGQKLGPMSIFAFFTAVVLTVVPSPLFEPRYYIVPLVVFRLFTAPEDHGEKRNIIEFMYLNAINALAFTVFFNYEFTWASEPGLIQRIIW